MSSIEWERLQDVVAFRDGLYCVVAFNEKHTVEILQLVVAFSERFIVL